MKGFGVPEMVVPLSPALKEYLLSDDMFLPKDAFPPNQEEEKEEEEEEEDRVVHDVAVEGVIADAIAEWKHFTIKVGETAATDAGWMMPFGNARCATLGHAYMLVKASNRLQARLEAGENELRVQKWITESPVGEYRCYTSGRRLAFAGQRYPLNSINVDLIEVGRRLHAIWSEQEMWRNFEQGVWQVDVWLKDDGRSMYVLGAQRPVEAEVEAMGVFSWQELRDGLPDDSEPCTVVRAITDSMAMAAKPRDGSGAPIDLHLLAQAMNE